MTINERIKAFLKENGYTDEDLAFFDSSSVYIAQQISVYAHRNQIRVNGDGYFAHPYAVMQLYRDFVGIVDDDYFCMDKDLLESYNIPYDGVQETCLLHDVLEDTDVTLEEMEEMFEGVGLGNYFRIHVKTPLTLLNHDKNEDYSTYIAKLMTNRVASIVKLMDLSNNMNPSSLVEFGNSELQRIEKYAICFKTINDKWHFLENADKYRKAFNSK